MGLVNVVLVCVLLHRLLIILSLTKHLGMVLRSRLQVNLGWIQHLGIVRSDTWWAL
jgi:hypothetical protein